MYAATEETAETCEEYIDNIVASIKVLPSKGYPLELANFYDAKVGGFKTSIESQKKVYAAHVIMSDEKDPARVQQVDEAVLALEAAITQLHKEKRFR